VSLHKWPLNKFEAVDSYSVSTHGKVCLKMLLRVM